MEHPQYPTPATSPPGRQEVFGKKDADGTVPCVWLTCNPDYDLIRLVLGRDAEVDLSPDKAIRIARAIILCDRCNDEWSESLPTLCKSQVVVRNTDESGALVCDEIGIAIGETRVQLETNAAYDLAFFLIDAARFITNVGMAFWKPNDEDTWDRVCRVCGCSDESACEDGCDWHRVPKGEKPLCSGCADHCDVCLQPADARKPKAKAATR